MFLMFISACGTSEITTLPKSDTAEDVESDTDTDIDTDSDSDADSDADADSDTDSDADSDADVEDPNPAENGDVLIHLQLGRPVALVEFWYGYCATREAAECPEFAYVGQQTNTRTYDFTFVGTSGAIKFDAYIDDDGDNIWDSDLAEMDGNWNCYTTAEVTAFMDGESVTPLLSSITTDGCLIGLSLSDAWNSITSNP
jgi:hypothetical protein